MGNRLSFWKSVHLAVVYLLIIGIGSTTVEMKDYFNVENVIDDDDLMTEADAGIYFILQLYLSSVTTFRRR